MAKKEKKQQPEKIENAVPDGVLVGKKAIADELKMSEYQFGDLIKKYPFIVTGVSGKISGRWRVTVEDVWAWFRFVQGQESRHPDSRRMRPQEPPGIKSIQGR
jgi:hypothetical protein